MLLLSHIIPPAVSIVAAKIIRCLLLFFLNKDLQLISAKDVANIIDPAIIVMVYTVYHISPRCVSFSTSLANHCQSLIAYDETASFTYLLTLSVRRAHDAIASHSFRALPLWPLALDLEYS